MDNFNIVLLGESFPVGSIDLEDFKLLGRPMKELVRLPILLEAGGGEFTLTLIPERFQVGVVGANPTDDKLAATRNACLTFLEYAGRRTISAVGHNFSVSLPSDAGEEALSPLVNYQLLQNLVGTGEAPVADLTTFFNTGADSTGQLKLLLREGTLKLDFNFHFAIRKGSIAVEEAIALFRDSLVRAREISEAIPTVLGAMETA